MTPQELLSLFRAEVQDLNEPYFFSDEEIYRYMDEAQKMLCRESGGIADSTSAITSISYSAGDEFVEIDPSILKIRLIRRASDGYDIRLLNFEDVQLGRGYSDCDYGQIRHTPVIDTDQGEVKYAISGMEDRKLRLLKIPAEDGGLKLTVYRLSTDIALDGSTNTFDVDAQHHYYLLDWMKHLAYSKQDAETFDRDKAMLFGNRFIQYAHKMAEERRRREHKYRSVQYGGL